MALESSHLMLRSINNLADYRVGMRKSMAENLIVPTSVKLSIGNVSTWKELTNGKLDMWVVEESVADYYARKYKTPLKTLLVIDQVDFWLGVGAEVPKEVLVRLNAELRKQIKDKSAD